MKVLKLKFREYVENLHDVGLGNDFMGTTTKA